MSRRSQTYESPRDSLSRVADAVGRCIGRRLELRCYNFIGAASGLECWRAYIGDAASDDHVTTNNFSWTPAAGSREAALDRALRRCLDFFGAGSVEELELKLAVMGGAAVRGRLGLFG